LVNANRLQNVEMPQANTDQAIQGTKLSTWQPVSVSHPRATISHIQGGPQMTDELRGYGSDLTKSAILRQMGGNELDTSTFPTDESLGLKSTKSNGTLDALLGYGSTAAGLLSALGIGGGTGAGAGAGAAAGAAWPGSGTQMTSLTAPTTTASTGSSGTGMLSSLFGGGTSTGLGGNAAWLAEELKKALMGQGMFAGGGGPYDDPNYDQNGNPLPPRN
jgi:hypothetical protein